MRINFNFMLFIIINIVNNNYYVAAKNEHKYLSSVIYKGNPEVESNLITS